MLGSFFFIELSAKSLLENELYKKLIFHNMMFNFQ